MPIRITGMNSGLDTEAIIEAMVSAYSAKTDKYKKAQTKVTYKQDAWKALNTKVYSLYSSVSNLRFSTAYNMKKTSVSDATKASVVASSTAVTGTQSLKIKSLATAGYLTGAKLDAATTEKTKLGNLGTGITDSATINVKVGSDSKAITFDADETVSTVIDKLKSAGLNANYDQANQRIFVSSEKSGKENDFTLTASNQEGLNLLANRVLMTSTAADRDTYNTKAGMVNHSVVDGATVIDSGEWDTLQTAITDVQSMIIDRKDLQTSKATAESEATVISKKIDSINASNEVVKKYIDTIDDPALSESDKDVLNDKLTAEIKKLSKEGVVDLTAYGLEESATESDIKAKLQSGDITKDDIQTIYDNAKATVGDETSGLTADLTAKRNTIDNLTTSIETFDATIESVELNGYKVVDLFGENVWLQKDEATLFNQAKQDITTAAQYVDGTLQMPGTGTSEEDRAVKIDGADAVIDLNGAKFTSSSNSFSINGLTIQAKAVTAENEAITLTTDTDVDGLYDKIKDFFSEYNSVINEMNKLYNADAAKGYEPLTDDEKAEMSDKEVEKWEQKIREAILRRDGTLGDLINVMTTSMMKSYEDGNGNTYSLGSFGIQTLGFMNAAKNEQYAYHIDGDPDDSSSSGSADKLRAAITSDPDSVINFMKQLTSGLYSAIDNKMKSSSISSAFTVYNDKEMEKEQTSYKELIDKWTQRVTDMEDKYYKQFAAMESALAKMQSNSSSVTSLLG